MLNQISIIINSNIIQNYGPFSIPKTICCPKPTACSIPIWIRTSICTCNCQSIINYRVNIITTCVKRTRFVLYPFLGSILVNFYNIRGGRRTPHAISSTDVNIPIPSFSDIGRSAKIIAILPDYISL